MTGEQVATVDTEKTSISDVSQPIQVQQLPLNQRSFTSLVTQQPGIVSLTNTSNNAGQTPTSVTWAQGSQISANGQVSSNMAYLIDGVSFRQLRIRCSGQRGRRRCPRCGRHLRSSRCSARITAQNLVVPPAP